jgi:serum/glucocorticoid-regulated kinase 2|eukprot:TRINITY_DN181_c2_g1_i3.p1 TRINITY_DN181_c2_g1~~TRINITY_DN181_c2_g1_i3.p1  ORF type:complete len:479 (+),score=313.73 TRINITY_DN181_c2_g1_i3:98-1438(+)
MSLVEVKVLSASGLPNASGTHFCTVSVDTDTVTTASKSGASPNWNEEFSFFGRAESHVKVAVFDNSGGKDALVGEYSVQVGTIKPNDTVEGAQALSGGGSVTVSVSRRKQEKVGVDDFDLLAVVGKGSYGKVMQVRKKNSGEMYAMKVLRKDKIVQRNQIEHTRSEVRVLQTMHHPFTVTLRYSFQTEDKLYLILDYVNGGELFFHLSKEGTFAEDRARLYTAEILLALTHLHRHNIIYRDLKPENILLDKDGHIRITDFGLCKEDMAHGAQTETFCGTPEYMAPEIVSGKPYGKAVDWWTLGTLLYEMIAGVPPFYSENVNTMYQKILTAPLKFPDHVSADARSLLEMMLQREPEKRLGSGPLDGEEIKRHPFFKTMDWDRLVARQIDAPFKPTVEGGAADHANFDEEFTSERAIDSVVDGSKLSESVQGEFSGFTYTDPSALGK